MKIDGLKLPKSSFLSMEKDMNLIVNKMFKNERLKMIEPHKELKEKKQIFRLLV